MYRLQVSTIPTLTFVDNKSDGSQHVVSAAKRLERFKKTLLGEIEEIDPVIELAELANPSACSTIIVGDAELAAISCLTSVADLLADIIVYCVSEMRKFGLPPAAIMAIVMESNKSKLQSDGSAKYDDNGKFLKGLTTSRPSPN